MNEPVAFFWSGVVIALFPVLVFVAIAGIAIVLSRRALRDRRSQGESASGRRVS